MAEAWRSGDFVLILPDEPGSKLVVLGINSSHL